MRHPSVAIERVLSKTIINWAVCIPQVLLFAPITLAAIAFNTDRGVMSRNRSSLKPLKRANRSLRQRLDITGELLLAAPTAIVLSVLALVVDIW